jgi:hypothetical protein
MGRSERAYFFGFRGREVRFSRAEIRSSESGDGAVVDKTFALYGKLKTVQPLLMFFVVAVDPVADFLEITRHLAAEFLEIAVHLPE